MKQISHHILSGVCAAVLLILNGCVEHLDWVSQLPSGEVFSKLITRTAELQIHLLSDSAGALRTCPDTLKVDALPIRGNLDFGVGCLQYAKYERHWVVKDVYDATENGFDFDGIPGFDYGSPWLRGGRNGTSNFQGDLAIPSLWDRKRNAEHVVRIILQGRILDSGKKYSSMYVVALSREGCSVELQSRRVNRFGETESLEKIKRLSIFRKNDFSIEWRAGKWFPRYWWAGITQPCGKIKRGLIGDGGLIEERQGNLYQMSGGAGGKMEEMIPEIMGYIRRYFPDSKIAHDSMFWNTPDHVQYRCHVPYYCDAGEFRLAPEREWGMCD